MKKPRGYWTYTNRELAASDCTSRTEYNKKYKRAYLISVKSNELNEFALKYNWKTFGDLYHRMIYVYVFEKYKKVYVGLSYNEERRKNEHLNKSSKKTAVYKFIENNELNIDDYIYIKLTDYIDVNEAVIKEAEYMDYYISLGYDLLCDRKKAGQLGGNNIKWNYDLRLEVASKCKSKYEYYTKYISAYEISIKSDEIDIFSIKFNWNGKKRNGYWKIKSNRIKAASECKTKSEYQNKYSRAYEISRQLNELLEFF